MAIYTAIDPILLVKEILNSNGYTDVNYQLLEGRSVSPGMDTPYIFLEQVGGVTQSVGAQSYNATIQILVYAREDTIPRNSFKVQSRIQSILADARGKKYTQGGIHHMRNRLSPQRQDIPGIPYGVGRTVSQHEFVLRTLEGWA